MAPRIKDFAVTDSGAVTVDWVVLGAAVIMLGVGVMQAMYSGASNISSALSNTLTDSAVTVNLD